MQCFNYLHGMSHTGIIRYHKNVTYRYHTGIIRMSHTGIICHINVTYRYKCVQPQKFFGVRIARVIQILHGNEADIINFKCIQLLLCAKILFLTTLFNYYINSSLKHFWDKFVGFPLISLKLRYVLVSCF